MSDFVHKPEDKDNNSFVRWQQLSISEMGKMISLFLGIAFATIGFVVSQLIGADFIFRNYWDKFLFLWQRGSFGTYCRFAHSYTQ